MVGLVSVSDKFGMMAILILVVRYVSILLELCLSMNGLFFPSCVMCSLCWVWLTRMAPTLLRSSVRCFGSPFVLTSLILGLSLRSRLTGVRWLQIMILVLRNLCKLCIATRLLVLGLLLTRMMSFGTDSCCGCEASALLATFV